MDSDLRSNEPSTSNLCRVWTCRDGRKIRLRDMDERHIRNCLRMAEEQRLFPLPDEYEVDATTEMIERHRRHWRKLWVGRFKAELKRRGL
jgi:hypothetical protein